MFIYLLIIIAILFFLSWNFNINHRVFHAVSSTVMTIIFVLGVILSIANFHDHYGMHKQTSTKTTQIASLSPKMNMVMYQAVGTSNRDQALIYKVNGKQIVVKPDIDVKNKIVQKSDVKTAQLVTKTTRWKYNSNFSRMMFDLAQKESVAHRDNTIYVPSNWLVITPKQAKALPNILKDLSAQSANDKQAQAQIQATAKVYVQKAVTDAMKKQPSMSASQQAAIGQKASAEFKAKAQQQAVQKMLPTLRKELAKIK